MKNKYPTRVAFGNFQPETSSLRKSPNSEIKTSENALLLRNFLKKEFWRIYGIKHAILHILEFIALAILFISIMWGNICQ